MQSKSIFDDFLLNWSFNSFKKELTVTGMSQTINSSEIDDIISTVIKKYDWSIPIKDSDYNVKSAVAESALREHIIIQMGKHRQLILHAKTQQDVIKLSMRLNLPPLTIAGMAKVDMSGTSIDDKFSSTKFEQLQILRESQSAEESIAKLLDSWGIIYKRETHPDIARSGSITGTPDFVLNEPLMTNMSLKPINWIEIKNYFGGIFRLEKTVRQIKRYRQYFGVGMIIFTRGFDYRKKDMLSFDGNIIIISPLKM